MRVWVLWSYLPMRGAGVEAVASDETLQWQLKRTGDRLRLSYGAEGEFRRVRDPEAFYRDDERVFRSGGITLVARPFMVDAPVGGLPLEVESVSGDTHSGTDPSQAARLGEPPRGAAAPAPTRSSP